MVLEGVAVIPVFFNFTGIFHRNSWGTGIPVFTPDSSGFLRIPEDPCSCQKLLALSSDKRRLFVIWTKLDLFNLSLLNRT